MPVRTGVLTLALERRSASADLRLRRLAIDYRAAHRTSSITAMARRVCSTMPVAMRRRAGAARLGRSIAQVDAARERAFDQRVGPVARADEDEVRLALHVREPEPIAGGVEHRLRLGDLSQVAVQVIEIVERRQDRHGGGDVDAVDRHRPADRIDRVGRADQAADPQAGEAERLRKRPPDDHVREGVELGDEADAGELGVGLVDEHDRAGRHAARDRADGLERHVRRRSGCSGSSRTRRACSA